MADVTRLPGVLEQLRLVAGLRWGMLRNSLRRKNDRWDLIGVIFGVAGGGLLVAGICVGFYVGTAAFLNRGRAGWMALLFWAIFVWWQILPIFVAGFGANFEFRNLLRFPLSLRAFYILGLGYGFADFAAGAALCWIASMLLACAWTNPQVLPAFALVSLLFILTNVTLERLIGSWMERIFASRRAREILVGIFVLSMVSLNFLNPALRRWGEHNEGPKFLALLPYVSWLPGSLAGDALASAARADMQREALALGGLVLWVAVAGVLLLQRYRAQYFGEEISEGRAPGLARHAARKQSPSAGELRFLSPAIAGMVRKEFHYLTRNGFSFFTLLLPPVMVLFFSLQFAGPNSALKDHGLSLQTFYPAVMGYLILILMSPAYNSFAFEGRGIQSYFMAPVRMRDVLAGKNLFLVCLVALELTIAIGVMVWRMGFPSLPSFLSTIAVAAFGVAGQLAIANWSSLSFPKKMEIGKMKGQRNSGAAVWIAFGVQIVLGGIAAAVFLAGRWFGNAWLPVVLFAGLTAAALGGYVAALDPLSELAERKKEVLIETLCR